MDGQPRFLTTLSRGRIGLTVDPKSRKRKALKGDKEPSGIRNKGNLSATTTWKQVSMTPQPGSGPQNAVVIPPSSNTLPPLPPPPSTTRVPRPIWESRVNTALRTAIRPPSHFYDSAPYNEAMIRELQTIELNAMKAASLTQTLASVQLKYGRAVDELQVCMEDKNKTYEELMKVKEDYKIANRDLLSLQQKHADNVQFMQDFKVRHELLEKKLQENENALWENANALADTQKKLEETEDKLKDAELDADNCRVDLAEVVEGFFQNALNQIRVLNPDNCMNSMCPGYIT